MEEAIDGEAVVGGREGNLGVNDSEVEEDRGLLKLDALPRGLEIRLDGPDVVLVGEMGNRVSMA